MATEFYDQFFCRQNNRFSIIIEDDGRVAYAYLLEEDDIIGDVWLYNQSSSPDTIDWDNENEMPFLNPKEYIKENISPILDSNTISIKWNLFENQKIERVSIFVSGNLIAVLSKDSKPGWSNFVVKNGPLAKMLDGTII